MRQGSYTENLTVPGEAERAEREIQGDPGRATASVQPEGLMTRGLTLLFAVAGGVAVGNLYLAQPLLELISGDLGASTASAGWLVTATQVGYAAGILFVVPLGDVRNRRHLIPTMMLCAAAALTLCAVAPSMGILLVAMTFVGVTTVSGQILAPLAGDLADVASRGHVVGIVVSGILTGILVSRTVSGLIADVAGWRVVFATAAVAGVVLAVLVYRAIPPLAPKARIGYPALIASVGSVVRRERALRWTMVLGATTFATFTMFWTSLTFLLSAPPFSYSVSVVGLFGLAGLAGVIAAQRAGRLHDRGWSLPATGAAWLLALLAFALASVAGKSLAVLIVVIVLVDIAVQALNILNQTRVFAISQEARSRINTAFVTSNFIGGAMGSAAATVLWSIQGWTAVLTAEVALCLVGLGLWAIGRHDALAVAPPHHTAKRQT
jgi:predicted MFS family arabinose efflux permease